MASASASAVPFGDMSPNLTTGTSSYNGLSVNLKKRFSQLRVPRLLHLVARHRRLHRRRLHRRLSAEQLQPQRRARLLHLRPAPPPRPLRRLQLRQVALAPSFLAGALSGFTVAPIIEISSGRPFNILTGTDTNFDFDPLTDRPNAVAQGATNSCGTPTVASKFSPTGYLNVPCYIDAPANAPINSSAFNGNLARNTGTRPFVAFTDLRLAKALPLGDHLALQITADAFNLINKNNTLDVNLLYTNAGQETASYDPRQFQFGARLSF